jgi:hypothetical protein
MASDSKAINFGDLRMYVTSPKGHCIERRPTTKSVFFSDEYLNLHTIAKLTAISVPMLSLVFARKRVPSVKSARKIAHALEMETGEFLKGLGLA